MFSPPRNTRMLVARNNPPPEMTPTAHPQARAFSRSNAWCTASLSPLFMATAIFPPSFRGSVPRRPVIRPSDVVQEITRFLQFRPRATDEQHDTERQIP